MWKEAPELDSMCCHFVEIETHPAGSWGKPQDSRHAVFDLPAYCPNPISTGECMLKLPLDWTKQGCVILLECTAVVGFPVQTQTPAGQRYEF